jgi:multiple sugar transport system ATP-binding protein
MLYVTHDQTEAMTLGNRIAVLNKGKLMQLGTPMNLYSSPRNRFVAGFIGSPTMNFIKGVLTKKEDSFFLTTSPGSAIFLGNNIPAPLNTRINDELEIGMRPESVLVTAQKNNGKQGSVGEVMAFENMGNEQLIYLSLKGQTIISRRSPEDLFEIGSKLFVDFPVNKIIYIDSLSDQVFCGTY